ncbi:hypothetical protein HALLA_19355 [Halostagnicola larsenii XH-48]|uniref:Uncharacterized protein n=1 Tax=Halostagnicola larsenii XH-48 TaxID=797299 RepID=W0JR31_9EURY|nr:hypothetical protein HALLA_19355 [Halostagnicola larsenii XH-48]
MRIRRETRTISGRTDVERNNNNDTYLADTG